MSESAVASRRTRNARLAHLVVTLTCGSGLLLQLVLILLGGADANSGDDTASVPLGTRLVRLVSYFTIQSNLLVFVVSMQLARRPERDGRAWRVLRLDALLGITVTGLVFVTVLAPLVQHDGAGAVANALLHYATPVLALVVWLLFGPRPRIRLSTVALAFGWPVAWVGYTLIHGLLTGWYPYPFLDLGQLGAGPALRNVGLVLVVALVLAAALAFLDRRLPARP